MKGPAINYNASVNLKCDHSLWAFVLPLGTLTHGGVFGIHCLSRGGESVEEFYIFSALHSELLRYSGVWQIFMRYLRNCSLEFWCCCIFKHADFFLIARRFLASLKLSNFSIFLFGVTEFSIPLAASIAAQILIFEHAYTSTIKQYSHGNLLCGWRPSLNPLAETFRKAAFILMDAEILWCNHSIFTWYHLLLWWWWDDDDDDDDYWKRLFWC